MAGFGIFFTIIPIVFMIMFGMVVFVMIKAIGSQNKYRKEPQLTSFAKCVNKRSYVRSNFTYYYATFEFSSGDRKELRVPQNQAGFVIEGDEGNLTFQGDMFIEFSNNPGGNDLY